MPVLVLDKSQNICTLRRGLMQAVLIAAVAFILSSVGYCQVNEPKPTAPTVLLQSPAARDQDDMCVWVHPDQKDRSAVITSDKSTGKLFVYDLQGRMLQELSVTKPGNVDIRQRVLIGGELRDLVVVNLRAGGFRLAVFQVDATTRKLQRLDNDDLATGPNYGGCLFHSPKTGRLSFICTSEVGMVEQYELSMTTGSPISIRKVRSWPLGKCEGAVADDTAGVIFISEETKGIWRFPAEPDQAAIGALIIPIGQHGLKGDVEGLALRQEADGAGFLLVSDQGSDRYAVYDRQPPHAFVTQFSIEGAQQTDGIDLTSVNLGPGFPEGLFACHTDRVPRPVLLTSWRAITQQSPKLRWSGVVTQPMPK